MGQVLVIGILVRIERDGGRGDNRDPRDCGRGSMDSGFIKVDRSREGSPGSDRDHRGGDRGGGKGWQGFWLYQGRYIKGR